jgi:hypothetical protein
LDESGILSRDLPHTEEDSLGRALSFNPERRIEVRVLYTDDAVI